MTEGNNLIINQLDDPFEGENLGSFFDSNPVAADNRADKRSLSDPARVLDEQLLLRKSNEVEDSRGVITSTFLDSYLGKGRKDRAA